MQLQRPTPFLQRKATSTDAAERSGARALGGGPDLARLPSSGGSGLSSDVSARFQSTTGQAAPAGVQVHTGAESRSAADAMGARAFTMGQSIHMGSAGSATDTGLMLHETTHTLHQAGGGATTQTKSLGASGGALEVEADRVADAGMSGGTAPVSVGAAAGGVQCDVIGDVRDKLSYGAFDWCITDREAMDSLALLGGIAPASLAGELARLEDKYVTRLLDNLPGRAKTGEIYTRVLVTLGPTRVMPYITDLLSYGVFDWAITDAEVSRVFNVFEAFGAAEKEQLITRLYQTNKLGRLISNCNANHHVRNVQPWVNSLPAALALTAMQQTLVKCIFDRTADTHLETLKFCFSKRFGLTVGASIGGPGQGETAIDWDAAGLRRSWGVMEALPVAHVAGNASLDHYGRYDNADGVSGWYFGRSEEAAIGYRAGHMDDTQNTDDGDPLQGVNRFNKVIRHEVGHGVDRQIGWARGAEPAKPERGGWHEYGTDRFTCADDMTQSAGSAIAGLNAVKQMDVLTAMENAMTAGNCDGLAAEINAIAGLTAEQKTAILADPAITQLRRAMMSSPWYNHTDGGSHLGDHVYFKDGNDWARFEFAARARKVSQYQFRAPGEWFAEAYAAYYEPDTRGRGSKLADRDADTKRWFDENVHTLANSR